MSKGVCFVELWIVFSVHHHHIRFYVCFPHMNVIHLNLFLSDIPKYYELSMLVLSWMVILIRYLDLLIMRNITEECDFYGKSVFHLKASITWCCFFEIFWNSVTARILICWQEIATFQTVIKLFKYQPPKMAKHSQTICWLLSTNCLNVFDDFVGLAHIGLIDVLFLFLHFIWYFNLIFNKM